MDDELVLMHYGTKGMKWGVRKSKKETGVSRAAGAAADGLRDQADRASNIARAQRGVSKKLGLPDGAGARQDNKAARLNAAADRIVAGKATVRDKLEGSMHVSALSLVVTTRAGDYQTAPKTPKKSKTSKPSRKPLTKTGRLLKEEREANKKAGVKVGDAKWRQANKDRFSRK